MIATIDGIRCRTRHFSGGFTLLELLVAMLAASVLLAGLSSALFLTMQATQPDVGGHDSTLRGSRALVDLSGELRFAKAFTLRTDKAVEFTVADRSGEGDDETIRWQWSGTAGDPLTRQYNGGAVVDILDNVHDFQLSQQIDSVTTMVEDSSGETTSEESLFTSFEGWQGITPTYLSNNLGTTSWAAEYFQIQGLPAEITGMAITRISLRLKKGAGGNILVSVHKAVGGGNLQPQADPIGSPVSVDAQTLPAGFEWVDIPFSDVTLDDPHEEFVVLIKGTINYSGQIERLQSYSAPDDEQAMLLTTNSGATWNPPASYSRIYDTQFRVYGTYTTSTQSESSVTRYFVVSNAAAVQVGAATSNRVETTTTTLNRCEVPSP